MLNRNLSYIYYLQVRLSPVEVVKWSRDEGMLSPGEEACGEFSTVIITRVALGGIPVSTWVAGRALACHPMNIHACGYG